MLVKGPKADEEGNPYSGNLERWRQDGRQRNMDSKTPPKLEGL